MAEQGALARATGNVSATLYALYRANLAELFALCAASGMRFHLTAIPPAADVQAGSVAFDQGLMRRLFASGYEAGKAGVKWQPAPPAADPAAEEKPRAGVVFTTR